MKDWTGAVGMAGEAWEGWKERDQTTALWRENGEWVEDGNEEMGTGMRLPVWEGAAEVGTT